MMYVYLNNTHLMMHLLLKLFSSNNFFKIFHWHIFFRLCNQRCFFSQLFMSKGWMYFTRVFQYWKKGFEEYYLLSRTVSTTFNFTIDIKLYQGKKYVVYPIIVLIKFRGEFPVLYSDDNFAIPSATILIKRIHRFTTAWNYANSKMDQHLKTGLDSHQKWRNANNGLQRSAHYISSRCWERI